MSQYRVQRTPISCRGSVFDPGSIIEMTEDEAANIGAEYLEKVEPATPPAEPTAAPAAPAGEPTPPATPPPAPETGGAGEGNAPKGQAN